MPRRAADTRYAQRRYVARSCRTRMQINARRVAYVFFSAAPLAYDDAYTGDIYGWRLYTACRRRQALPRRVRRHFAPPRQPYAADAAPPPRERRDEFQPRYRDDARRHADARRALCRRE